jgi:hypothetical protein
MQRRLRSRFVRRALLLLSVASAGLAVAQIGGLLGKSPAEPSSLVRVLPARVEVLSGAASANDPWRLFDGDTGRGFHLGQLGAARLRLVLTQPQALAAIGVFGPANGRLTIWADPNGGSAPLLDLVPRAAGWQRVPL